MRSTRSHRQGGFAFLLVLIAVVMMSVTLASAAQIVSIEQRRDRELELLSIGRQIRTAIQSYHDVALIGGVAQYPRSWEDLLNDHRIAGPVRHHLRKVFVDPMTGKTDWELQRAGDFIVGVRSSSGNVPLKQSGFEGEELGYNGATSYRSWVFAPQGVPAAPQAR